MGAFENREFINWMNCSLKHFYEGCFITVRQGGKFRLHTRPSLMEVELSCKCFLWCLVQVERLLSRRFSILLGFSWGILFVSVCRHFWVAIYSSIQSGISEAERKLRELTTLSLFRERSPKPVYLLLSTFQSLFWLFHVEYPWCTVAFSGRNRED